MTARVLFVDSSRSLLQELETALASARSEWAVVCARSPAEAFEQMARGEFDVVVADAAALDANGGSFFDEVAVRHPKAARFLLSGQSGSAMLLRADTAAHQHLARPMQAGEVFARLEQTLMLDALLSDPDLKAVVSRLKSVPSLTPVYVAIMSELRKEEASARRVGDLVAKDSGMAAKILQLANSPFFGSRMAVVEPAQAVQRLGLETVRALVLTVHVFQQLDLRTVTRFRLGKVWRHSIAAAGFARLIARLQDAPADVASEAFTAALLHDIGKLVLAGSLPDDYAVIVEQAESDDLPTWQVELELMRTTHAEIGAYLLGLWGLPEPIVEAVARHHHPSESPAPDYCPLGAVHVADVIEHEVHPDNAIGVSSGADAPYLERFGVAARLLEWTAACLGTEAEGQKSLL